MLEGGSGAPVVFLHSAGGLLRDNPFLDQLAQRYSVFAPEWPGYGESTGEELLEDIGNSDDIRGAQVIQL